MLIGRGAQSLVVQNKVMVFSRESSQQGAQVKLYFETHYPGLHVEIFECVPPPR